MNYTFHNLLGAPYRGGNVQFSEKQLYSAVGNRVSCHDLANGVGSTLPIETEHSVRVVAVSPNGRVLFAIDETGRAVVTHALRRVALHHFSFKGPVRTALFSPDGRWLAVAVGRLVQVWAAPTGVKEPSPMHLHNTFGQSRADVTCLAWSADSLWVAAGAKDLAVRVFSLDPIPGYTVPLLFGHKDRPVGVFFTDGEDSATGSVKLVSVSRDGAVFGWEYDREGPPVRAGAPGAEATGPASGSGSDSSGDEEDAKAARRRYSGGRWRLASRDFFHQNATRTECCDLHPSTGMLVAGFSTGIFGLYRLGDGVASFQEVHVLSVSREALSAAQFDATGEWVALGCSRLGQLLVWEWRSETYVLKQQGHVYDVATCAYSPDGGLLVTGADDAKVKVWDATAGSCFVTFTDHTAPVTAVAFLPNNTALVSASLDGTCRAYDLVRYRNFRTMATPQPVQLASLAVDPGGEVVCAGSLDTFQIYVWSLRTGQLLDVLAAHEGPAVALSFNPMRPLLASASWDKTVKVWDVFSGNKVAVETLHHSHDVLALAHCPSGKQLCSSTLDGHLHFWDAVAGQLQGALDVRRDVAGGRLPTDRRAAGNASSGKCITSLAYSADGAFVVGGGATKYVCVYDTQERVMLARFQISRNRSLAGVLDQLNSRNMTEAGPVDLIDDIADDEDDDPEGLGARAADAAAASGLPGTASRGGKRAVARSRCIALSPTGRQWAACTTEGVLIYSLDEAATFDPTDLEEDITPAAVHRALAARQPLRALLLALRLNDPALISRAILACPLAEVAPVAQGVPPAVVPRLLATLAEMLSGSPHLEFLLLWARALSVAHGEALRSMPRHVTSGPLRALQRAVQSLQGDLQRICEGNLYLLDYATTDFGAARKQATGGEGNDDGEVGMDEDGGLELEDGLGAANGKSGPHRDGDSGDAAEVDGDGEDLPGWNDGGSDASWES